MGWVDRKGGGLGRSIMVNRRGGGVDVIKIRIDLFCKNIKVILDIFGRRPIISIGFIVVVAYSITIKTTFNFNFDLHINPIYLDVWFHVWFRGGRSI